MPTLPTLEQIRRSRPMIDRLLNETLIPSGNDDPQARRVQMRPEMQPTRDVAFGDISKRMRSMQVDPAELALGLAGGPSMAMFAGPMAKTANHQLLALAKEMLGKKAAPEQIWKETGWFQGADKKWRFEISDHAASLNPKAAKAFEEANIGDAYKHNADRVMQHPELFEAYPDLWRANIDLTKGGGYPYRPSGHYSVQESGRESIGVNANTVGRANSMALHELQHAIQQREGFAQGADFNAVGMKDYVRSAGEVEASNVQRRKFMTPSERAAVPPWETENVPRNDQIVDLLKRFGLMGALSVPGVAELLERGQRRKTLAEGVE